MCVCMFVCACVCMFCVYVCVLYVYVCVYMCADAVDPVMDEQLAMFVVESHRRSHPNNKGGGGQEASQAGEGNGDEDLDATAIINDKVQ